ncbi:hypothetical protein SEA_LUCKYLEO_60 [Gordonia phage LuckyLeo]|nr:hypothetical protein SEA_LUCKYLEO_60 [Gordonia phage LuckyLeo]
MSQESRRMKALEATCPTCLSPPHQRCTQPTVTGRKPVRWVHLKRESAQSEHEA